MTSETKAFSSTGKALLAGGYLVLDPQYKALVIALSARMHAVVSSSESEKLSVSVKSPQFKEGEWCYDIVKGDAISERNGGNNPFVASTIDIVVKYVQSLNDKIDIYSSKKHIQITMFSDAEYHSQVNSRAKTSDNGHYTFLYHDEPITKVSKTGLGSSAGLVTSLTAALLYSFIPNFDANDNEWKKKVHNLAQISHCKAQGKIGSGFDVASATFGSIFYNRFSPKIVNDLLAINSTQFSSKLKNVVDNVDWNMVNDPCHVPKGLTLLMGDVKGGSETPKMVSKVNDWRSSYPEKSQQVWKRLNESNLKLMRGFNLLNGISRLDPKRYDLLLQYSSTHKGLDFLKQSEFPELVIIVEAFKEIRESFRLVTQESGADIEPLSQTQLLDACWNFEGVFGGVVPGAGGFDAICVLATESNVDEIKSKSIDDERFASVRWMDLHEENYGLIEEPSEDFNGLL